MAAHSIRRSSKNGLVLVLRSKPVTVIAERDLDAFASTRFWGITSRNLAAAS
jgi:hypothetical protein